MWTGRFGSKWNPGLEAFSSSASIEATKGKGRIKRIRPIALILPSLQMAELPHYVPLIDGSIEQPAQETVKKLSCQSRVDPIPYLKAQNKKRTVIRKRRNRREILWLKPCHELDSNQPLQMRVWISTFLIVTLLTRFVTR